MEINSLSPSDVSKKRKSLTLDYKIAVLNEAETTGEKKSVIAKRYGLPRNTLSTWIKNRDTIRSLYAKNIPYRKRLRAAWYSDVEDALVQWINEIKSSNIPINGPLIMNKAKEFAQLFGREDFSCSSGWLHRFKWRHNIVFTNGKDNNRAGSKLQENPLSMSSIHNSFSFCEPSQSFPINLPESTEIKSEPHDYTVVDTTILTPKSPLKDEQSNETPSRHASSAIQIPNTAVPNSAYDIDRTYRPKLVDAATIQQTTTSFNNFDSFDWSSNSDVRNWSCEHVKRWLAECGLTYYMEGFTQVDGSLLSEMYAMRKDAPEAFYRTLREDHRMTFIDFQKFTKPLRQLFSGYNYTDKQNGEH